MKESPKVDLVGVGLNATDTLIPLAEFPARGSKSEYSGGTIMPGGQVATAIIACQSWGATTRYVGKLGDDDASRLHREAFAKAGVEAKIVEVAGGISARSLILVDSGGERTVLCRRDERMELKAEDLRPEWIINSRVLHVDGHDTAAAILAARWAKEVGIPVVGDLDDLYPGVDDLLEMIDYLIVSRDFPCRLMHENDLKQALRAMHARYACKLTGATLGPDGVLAWDGEQFRHCAAYRVPVVDTTGAGDIFHAGFLYGLLQKWPLEHQLDFACAAAALNCTAQGARGGIQPVAAIEKLMASGERHEVDYGVYSVETYG